MVRSSHRPATRRSISRFTALLVSLVVLHPLAVRAGPPDAIVIGRSLPLTGPIASYGAAKRDGADAYIHKVNNAGGVVGRQIKLVTLDDAYEPPKAISNLRKLAAEDQPSAFLGLIGVPVIAASLPVLMELKIPTVGLTAGIATMRTPHHPYAFPVRASYADETRKLAGHVKTTAIERVAVIYTDNSFGEAVKEAMVSALQQAGVTASTLKVDAAGTDAREAVSRATGTAPQAIMLSMLSKPAVAVMAELGKTDYRGAMYAISAVDASAMTLQLGGKARGLAITQVVPIPAGTKIRVVAEYIQALHDLGRGTPSFYGLEAYIEAKVLVEGLKRAGPAATPAALANALETMRDLDVGGYYVSFAPGAHTGSRFVEMVVIDEKGAVIR